MMLAPRHVGRRYTDLHRESSLAPYPLELERRRKRRRDTDREEGLEEFGAEYFKRYQRLPVLYSASWSCNRCGREGKQMPNLPSEGRHYVVADFTSGALNLPICACGASEWNLNWRVQSGRE